MHELTEIRNLNELHNVAAEREENAGMAAILSPEYGLGGRMADAESMRAMATRLSLALKLGQIGVWQWSFKTNAVTWDARMHEIYGIPLGTPVTPELWKSAIHPEDIDLASGIFSRSVQHGLHSQHRFRILHPGKGIRFLDTLEQLVLDAEGNPMTCIGVDQDVTELFQVEESLLKRQAELEMLSLTDPATGVGNRRRLDEGLPKEVRRVRRYGGKLSLLLADLDRLKQLNDEFGHLVGDAALRAVVDTLQSSIRDTDWVARFGGDEFCVVLPETGVRGARKIAERARQKLEKTLVPPVRRPITVSFGVAELGYWEEAEALLQRADQALYRAKRAGRNQIAINRAEIPADLLLAGPCSDDEAGENGPFCLEHPFAKVRSAPVPFN
jgi:diguanylate cyclase (GGDEF)-like protein